MQHLAAMLREEAEALSGHIHRYIEHPSSAFAALNAAFMTDGAHIRLPDQAVIEDPIHLLFTRLFHLAAT